MCGRKTLTQGKLKIMEAFMADEWENDFTWVPSFNVAPTQVNPILLVDESRRIVPMRWGLIPAWAKDDKLAVKMINARSETLREKPSFRNLLKANRCIVLADGYYEWQKSGAANQPFYIHPTESDFLPMAGFWTSWINGAGKKVNSYTIITRPAADDLKNIHPRMPTILSMENYHQWADCNNFQADEAMQLLNRNHQELDFYPVSAFVNSPKNNSAKCLERMTNSQTLF